MWCSIITLLEDLGRVSQIFEIVQTQGYKFDQAPASPEDFMGIFFAATKKFKKGTDIHLNCWNRCVTLGCAWYIWTNFLGRYLLPCIWRQGLSRNFVLFIQFFYWCESVFFFYYFWNGYKGHHSGHHCHSVSLVFKTLSSFSSSIKHTFLSH